MLSACHKLLFRDELTRKLKQKAVPQPDIENFLLTPRKSNCARSRCCVGEEYARRHRRAQSTGIIPRKTPPDAATPRLLEEVTGVSFTKYKMRSDQFLPDLKFRA